MLYSKKQAKFKKEENMTEICVEIKENLEKVIDILKNLGYMFDERYVIHDTYYTTFKESDLKTISYKDLLNRSLIIRNIVGNSGVSTNIVYKNKTLDNNGNVINEIKTKLKIDDEEKAKTIFTNVGMTCWCDYINENIVYKKDDIALTLQKVENLGVFLEIEEYPSIKDKKEEDKFTILSNLAKSLNINLGEDYSVKKPYLFLKKH